MSSQQPFIIGEVLFDCFPDGRKVLGGAPFNVAWNLQGLGLPPMMVTAVGDDQFGQSVRSKMQDWQLSTEGLQVSAKWPTGTVQVELQEGQPTFQILADQAYDDIRSPEFPVTSERFSLLYQGSLAYRGETSRTTIQAVLQQSQLPRFVDINIRQPWFDKAWLDVLLTNATWTKLNQDELSWLTGRACQTGPEIQRAVHQLRERFGGRHYYITCGDAGAYASEEQDGAQMVFVQAPKPEPFVDSVGAGDAFSAAVIHGIAQGQALEETLLSAVHFAARICTLRGATTDDHDFYKLTDN